MRKINIILLSFILGFSAQVYAEVAAPKMTLNPCFGEPGVPYRKYYGFALTVAKTELLKFSCADCAPKSEAKHFDSVESFLVTIGVLEKSGQGYVIGVKCPRMQGQTYEAKYAELSPEQLIGGKRPGGNGRTNSGNQNREVGGEHDPLKAAEPLPNPVDSYYGMHLKVSMWCGYEEFSDSAVEAMKAKGELRTYLERILSSAHIQSKGQKDRLVESCSKVKTDEQCAGDQKVVCDADPELIRLKDGEKCLQEVVYTYEAARRLMFGKLYLNQDDQGYFVKDVYCQKNYRDADFSKEGSLGPYKIPFHQILNAEHTWPQSRFNPDLPKLNQKTDLHHLFPSASKQNSSRGNFPFAEIGIEKDSATLDCGQKRKGVAVLEGLPEGIGEGSITSYEPPDNHKGNVARALFYFAVKYKQQIAPVEEYYLRLWHQQDPVDANEAKRNNEIYQLQGTRNPFIDFENLVSEIADF